LIVSYDTIMNPPYSITSQILLLVSSISEKIGKINSVFLEKPSPRLRKQNRIKTIHNSLKIEGNTLTVEQVTGLIENKRVLGPQKDIREVRNAIELYDRFEKYDCTSEKSFLRAHSVLMSGLIDNPGSYRDKNVGIAKGGKLAHVAPPYHQVKRLMNDLFQYVKESDEPALIKSCVFHYEMEFIHPFVDGNGRMGRLWQMLILASEHSVFEYMSIESLIYEAQSQYYSVLSECDKKGNSTLFIEFMLDIIDNSLSELLTQSSWPKTGEERLEYFLNLHAGSFSRKDYLSVFRNISSATASRDLVSGVRKGILKASGRHNKTVYSKAKG
jgi:Fic family protein